MEQYPVLLLTLVTGQRVQQVFLLTLATGQRLLPENLTREK